MTDTEKYLTVLRELAGIIAEKDSTISLQKWQLDEVKKKLTAAEAEIEALKGDIKE